ncbi:type IV fimbrial biogenesis protein FimT [Herbaspirillum sp. Sphag1AN]|uniref:GspH/FimT family pseudopilin n=1 Tax=unclassified Herbaspirillum TaxID=2624150 RepID=UPI0016190FD7|nr:MULTISPECIES: GspH/FimT family pseudopilin [unclassified Herbaspirillum]MBB3214358.1 type IV fimbrial biogenesis protein FimT [Herbaspirillum sp. Sphag1AN]MBB3247410.1 type IV fimbrial biogenesis protein FimT [Herbaspirillum sp. Sphag64]
MSAIKPDINGAAGLTLVELLIVLSIVALLLAAGVPSFRHYLQTQQVNNAAGDFLFALNLARSEAMRRGTRVDLAARDGNDWQSGWQVFVRQSGADKYTVGSDDELIHSHAPLKLPLKLVARLSDRSGAYIAYNASGRTRTNVSTLTRQWGSWQFSLNGQARLIRLTLAGRARMCNPATDNSCQFAEVTETDDTSYTE